MLRAVILLLCLGSIQVAVSQEGLQVVASAGGLFQAGSLQLEWTIGEPVVSRLEGAATVLTQGFHQSSYSTVAVQPLPDDISSFEVFPNPFSSETTVRAAFTEFRSGHLELYDIQGQKIWSQSFEGVEISERISASTLVSGSYILILRLPERSSSYSFTLFKSE